MDIDEVRPPKPQLTRLTALYQRGEEVEFEDTDGKFFLYVAALTENEREEALLDGATAQAEARVLNGPGSKRWEGMLSELTRAERPLVIERHLMLRGVEAWMLGQDDLHADDYWRGDRLLLIERGDALVESGAKLDEEERQSLLDLNAEYLTAWRERTVARLKVMQSEYESSSDEDLQNSYLKAFMENMASRSQMEEYRITQLFYGVRACDGVMTSTGKFDHSNCDGHRRMVFPTRAAVRQAPDELKELLIPVGDRLDQQGGDVLGKSQVGAPGSR
jgi:hypothetical protein